MLCAPLGGFAEGEGFLCFAAWRVSRVALCATFFPNGRLTPSHSMPAQPLQVQAKRRTSGMARWIGTCASPALFIQIETGPWASVADLRSPCHCLLYSKDHGTNTEQSSKSGAAWGRLTTRFLADHTTRIFRKLSHENRGHQTCISLMFVTSHMTLCTPESSDFLRSPTTTFAPKFFKVVAIALPIPLAPGNIELLRKSKQIKKLYIVMWATNLQLLPRFCSAFLKMYLVKAIT